MLGSASGLTVGTHAPTPAVPLSPSVCPPKQTCFRVPHGTAKELPMKPLRPFGRNCLTIPQEGSFCTGFMQHVAYHARGCQGYNLPLMPLPALASAWATASAALRAFGKTA